MLCDQLTNRGFNAPGCFQEYTTASANFIVRLPDNLSFVQAAPVLCAGVTAYKALKQLELIAGSFIGILGAAGGLVLKSYY